MTPDLEALAVLAQGLDATAHERVAVLVGHERCHDAELVTAEPVGATAPRDGVAELAAQALEHEVALDVAVGVVVAS